MSTNHKNVTIFFYTFIYRSNFDTCIHVFKKVITTSGKCNIYITNFTLWDYISKQYTITCQKNIGDVRNYQKLFKSPPFSKTNWIPQSRKNEIKCGHCKELGHINDKCHWNFKTPNNKLKEKKSIVMNENFAQCKEDIK
jgi:hypothetical protein